MKSFTEEEGKPPRCSSYYNKRNFDFCKTEWTIEKFSLASCRAAWSFQTPEFTVRGARHATKWTMSLESGPSERSPIRLSLKRSSSDNGPDRVWVEWRTSVSVSGRHHGKTAVDTWSCFGNGTLCSCEGLASSEASIVESLEPFQEPDSLTVRCKLILFPEKGPSELDEEFEPCPSKHLECLSENLLGLFSAENDHHDLELQFIGDGKTIRAHKVVVLSRIRKLNYWLEQQRRGRKAKRDVAAASGRDVLNLSHLPYTAMRKVLEYAYSGDLKYVLAEPSLAVSDCVSALDVPELKSHYTPDTLAFRTRVQSNEIRLSWLVPLSVVGRLATSIEIVDDLYRSKWRLHLLPDANTDYFGIYAECVDDGHRLLDLCLDVALLDRNDDRVLSGRLHRSNDVPRGMFGFERFVSANAAALSESLTVVGCLRIVLRLQISEGHNASVTDSYDRVCVPERRGSYASLSADMASAFESGFFSDLRLENNGVLYKMHKCVVAARCAEMYRGIRRMGESDADTFPDVESNVFRALLRYIYTGVFDEPGEGDDTDFLTALHKTAAHFDLPLLKDCCSERLQRMAERNKQ